MAIQTTGSFPKGLVPGVKKWIEDYSAKSTNQYAKVFDKITSNRQYEEYAAQIGYGQAQYKPEGSNIKYDSAKQGWVTRAYNIAVALGFQITHEQIQDNNWGPLGKQGARDLTRAFDTTKETMAGLILSRAFNSSYAGADGLELCSTAHVNKGDGTTYSNELTTAVDLSELGIEQLCIQIDQAEDERGLNIPIMSKCLVVHPNDRYNAQRILKSELQNDSADNATNALRDTNMFSENYAVNNYFDAGNGAWFIKTDAEDGMVYQEREARRPGEDNNFDNMNARFSLYERYVFLWNSPRAFYGSAGAA